MGQQAKYQPDELGKFIDKVKRSSIFNPSRINSSSVLVNVNAVD